MDYFLMFGVILIILFSFVFGYVVGHSNGSKEAIDWCNDAFDWCDDAFEVSLEKKSPDNKHEAEE